MFRLRCTGFFSSAWQWRGRVSSLKFQLGVTIVCATALAIGITLWVLLQQSQHIMLQQRIDAERGQVLHNARLLGQRVAVQQAILSASLSQFPVARLADPQALRRYLHASPVLRAQFDGVFVADIHGQLLLLHDDKGYRQPDARIGDRAYFRQALDGAFAVSSALVGRVNAEPLVALAQPIIGEGQVVGVMGATVNLSGGDFTLSTVGAVAGDAGLLVVVTDSDGRIVAHPNRSLLARPLTDEPLLAAALARLQARHTMLADRALDLSDEHALIAVAAVPGTDWRVWHQRLRGDVLAPLQAGRRDAVATAGVVLVVLSLACLALSWWWLRPLQRLTARAVHLLDHQLAPDAMWPGSRGEVGTLEQVLRHVVSEHGALDRANRLSLRQLSSVMAAAPVGILFTRERRFELVSAEFCRMVGRSEADLVGTPTQTVFASNEDFAKLGPGVAQAFAAGQAYDGEWAMRRQDGSRFWTRLRGLPVSDDEANGGTVWTVQDIDHEVAEREALQWQASHDALTALPNRACFEREAAALHAHGPAAMPASLVLLDLDRFKPINDRHGHAAGDAMLRAVAQALRERVRSGDLVARLGGDEFGLLLQRCPASAALKVAHDVQAAVAALQVPWQGTVLTVGASVGVAALEQDHANLEAWIAAADHACYEAKAAGRNTVREARGAGHISTMPEGSNEAHKASLRLVSATQQRSAA